MPDMTNRRKTSMADIAKAADVSEATVDRVLNGRGGVSREKERRVLEWARKLKIDRALDAVSVRWLRIAILLQQPIAPYYVYLKQGFEIAQKAFEAQRVICAVTYFDSLEPAHVVETILLHGVDRPRNGAGQVFGSTEAIAVGIGELRQTLPGEVIGGRRLHEARGGIAIGVDPARSRG